MKKSNQIAILFLFLVLVSCENKKDVIEIYLTKNRIETSDGVPLSIGVKDSIKYQSLVKRFGKEIRIDTLKNDVIFAGHFTASKKDLEKKPFINNSEILGLDFEKSQICFSRSVAIKISNSIKNWRKEHRFGKQFVMCYNNKIILEGYFFNDMASYTSNTYQISFHSSNSNRRNDTIKNISYPISKSLNFKNNNLMKNKELYNAFKNRQIKE